MEGPTLPSMELHPAALAWHVTARLRRDRIIAPREGDSRRVAAVVLDQARPRAGFDPQLLAFSVPDTHIHLLLACDRAAAGRFVNHLLGGLACRLGLAGGFAPAWFGQVETQRHLSSTFHYVLRQHQRHETRHDPFREASNLPDLVGLRPMGRFTSRPVQRLLPRLRVAEIVPHLGLTTLRAASRPDLLSDVAAATVAAPSLRGKGRRVVLARRAAVHWGHGCGLSVGWMAQHLEADPRSVRRCLSRAPDPELVRAIGLQMGFREALAAPGRMSA